MPKCYGKGLDDCLRRRGVGDTAEAKMIRQRLKLAQSRSDNPMDGVPGLTQDAVQPNGSFDYEFTPPDAGTFWYHAHVDSWDQVAPGLFGALIIDEAKPAFAPENDHVLVLTDWRVDEAGGFDAASMGRPIDWASGGRTGNLLTVNGLVVQEIPLAASTAQRLRLINTSTARILRLELNAAKVLT